MKIFAAAALLLATPAFAATTELESDPAHSSASFAVKHMVVNTVRGEFTKLTSTVRLDKDDPARSSVEVKIDAASLDTHNEKRDAHLKSPDFFDVAKCPEIAFKSTRIEKTGADKYKVTGNLTMHCQTHPATLDAMFTSTPIKSPWGTTVYVGSATGTLKRTEWGLNWNKALEQAGGVLVGEDAVIEVNAEFLPKQPESAKK